MSNHLSEVLNGAKIANIAKRERVRQNTIYQRITNQVTELNRKFGTNLSTKVKDIKANREAYRDLLSGTVSPATTKQNKKTDVTTQPKRIYNLLRFNNALEAINSLEGDMRIGAVIMYNTLSND